MLDISDYRHKLIRICFLFWFMLDNLCVFYNLLLSFMLSNFCIIVHNISSCFALIVKAPFSSCILGVLVCICLCVYMCAYVYACKHACMCLCRYLSTHSCVHMYTYLCVHVCMYVLLYLFDWGYSELWFTSFVLWNCFWISLTFFLEKCWENEFDWIQSFR